MPSPHRMDSEQPDARIHGQVVNAPQPCAPEAPERSDKRWKSFRLSCPAKINLFLEVLGRRSDGYHELETVMLATDLSDSLTIRSAEHSQLTLRFSDATPEPLRTGIPTDDSNLILKAARAVREICGVQEGAEFLLHKRIPAQSGLGGGSSNAAGALRLCRELWNCSLTDADLHEIAARLGSDINFFLSRCAAGLCRGRGELVEPVHLNRTLWFVATRPTAGNCTADVFRHTRIGHDLLSATALLQNLAGDSDGNPDRLIFNRLTDAARLVNPQMDRLMRSLQQLTKRPVFMSGSGSTVFIVADHGVHAREIGRLLQSRQQTPVWLLKCSENSNKTD